MRRQPNQPVVKGCFQSNEVVRLLVRLVDRAGIDIEHLRERPEAQDIDLEDWDQFDQLTGMSVSAWVSGPLLSPQKRESVMRKLRPSYEPMKRGRYGHEGTSEKRTPAGHANAQGARRRAG